MAQDLLLEMDIADGRELVAALQREGMKIQGAYWLYITDIEKWKLQIVTDEAKGPTAPLYGKAMQTSRDFDFLGRVQFVPPSSTIFQGLRKITDVGARGRRVSHRVFDGIYVDEAFVYPVAA